MSIELSPDAVWKELARNPFAVIGYTNSKGEPRTAGIVYVVDGGRLWIGTGKSSWKARHLAERPAVSVTVAIPKSIPLMPFIKIPAATITFQGTCTVLEPEETPESIRKALMHGMAEDPKLLADMALLRIEPHGRFITYGVGVSLWAMRKPEQARGVAPVAL